MIITYFVRIRAMNSCGSDKAGPRVQPLFCQQRPTLRLFSFQAKRKPPRQTPADTRVYAVGDIHGCLVQLRALQEAIKEDAKGGPERLVVVYLGDFIDRGENSKGVIDHLLSSPMEGFEEVFLKGNHEDFLLKFLDDPGQAMAWLANGGSQTCLSYGFDPASPPDLVDDLLIWLHQEVSNRIPDDHLAFLKKLTLTHVEGGFFFCHAGVRPGLALEEQKEEDLLWIREPFLGSKANFEKLVVHGHTPTRQPDVRGNRIGIDTGACYGGKLTAMAIEKDDFRFIAV